MAREVDKATARESLRCEVMQLFWEASAADGPYRWVQDRFKGRFAEFGLVDDYAVAVELVAIAIGHRFHATDPLSAGNKDRAVLDRISQAKREPSPHGYLVINDRQAKELADEAVDDPVAWAACVKVVSEALTANLNLPYPLREWTARVLRGEITKPDKRKSVAGYLTPRDDAIRHAVRMAMESGAFTAPTHGTHTKALGPTEKGGRARSACELVAFRLANAGMGVALGYPQVAGIWEKRNRNNDSPVSGRF